MSNKGINKYVSNFVETQLPRFVRDDHPRFTAFLKAYYEFLEQEESVYGRLFKIDEYNDIDRSISEFAKYFHSMYLKGFPQKLAADKPNVIKHAKEFYNAKGSEDALKLLFRILYGDEIDVYYPKEDILRSSDGKWQAESYKLRVLIDSLSGNADDVFELEGKLIEQIDSVDDSVLASAIVTDLISFTVNGISLAEFTLQSLTGNFDCENNQPLRITLDSDTDSYAYVEGVCSFVGVEITDGGSGYEELEEVTVSGDGINASAFIERVNSGSVDGFYISDGGLNYEVGDTIVFNNEGSGGSGAFATVSAVDGSGTITDITFNSGGLGYVKSPLLDRIETINGSGALITFYGSEIGSVAEVKVRAPGVGYTTAPTITFRDPAADDPNTLYTQATGTAQLGSEIVISGRWLNDDGMLNERNFLQDSFFYQEFSYSIRSSQSVALYADVLRKVLHPSGQKFFGEISVLSILGRFLREMGTQVDTFFYIDYESNNLFNVDSVNALGMNFDQIWRNQHTFAVWDDDVEPLVGNTQIKDLQTIRAPWSTDDELKISDTNIGIKLNVSAATGDFLTTETVSISNITGTFNVLSWDTSENILYIENDNTIFDMDALVGETITGQTSGETATIDSYLTQRSWPIKNQWDTNMVHLIDIAWQLRYNLHYGSWRAEYDESIA